VPLSDDDLEKIVAKIKEAESTDRDFWLEPKEHYDQHARLDSLLKVFDQAKSSAIKIAVGFVILGVIFVASIFKFGGGAGH